MPFYLGMILADPIVCYTLRNAKVQETECLFVEEKRMAAIASLLCEEGLYERNTR
mgnify:CR=1 FL=1